MYSQPKNEGVFNSKNGTMLINGMQEEKQWKSNMMVTITVRVRALFHVKRDVREEERVRKLGHSLICCLTPDTKA